MKQRRTSLFKRAALTVAIGLLVFQLCSGLAMFLYLVLPLGQRAAEDQAALLVLSARAWASSTPEMRTLFAAELKADLELDMQEAAAPLNSRFLPYPYAIFLRTALTDRLGAEQRPRLSEDGRGNFQVEFAQGGHLLRFAFSKARVAPRPSWALAWIALAGTLATLGLAALLARRVSAPVAQLALAARRIGAGELPEELPETGEAELADLAQAFNQTARQLQARRENQTTLLAGVSHDLRSPLARLKMAAGLLAETSPSPLLQRMERDIEEMDRLIGAQLLLARAQERETPKIADVDALLAEMLATMEAQAPGRFRLRACAPMRKLEIAPLALRRCLANLLENALRYGGDGIIEVARKHCKHTLCIGVRDRGPGIPASQAQAVFRPFYRIESSRNRASGGSGLGLAITQRLADAQGWRVAVKARRGGGACVWLMIPATRFFL
jgi:two-component system osmolarity sensor histidine kinase EnvZ